MAKAPRAMLMTLMGPAVGGRLRQALHDAGVRWDETQFPMSNWHQSWCEPIHSPTTEDLRRLAGIGGRISASAFPICLNRVSGRNGRLIVHGKGLPPGFRKLLASVRSEWLRQGFRDPSNHTPHVSLAYWSALELASTPIPPVEWWIEEICLVLGGGDPYRYEVLERWRLSPPEPPPFEQFSLI